jgi:D-alanyl-D-alanine carboxypeptidase
MCVLGVVLVGAAACGSSTPSSTSSTPSPSGTTTVGAGASVDAATAHAYQQVLDDVRAQGGFPGVVAGVWSPEGAWVGTSGTTGEGLTATPTAQDRTRIGSLTKTMTATVLLQLAQEGRLSLDDTIGTYVPGMPNGDVATLRQLADMSSGIPSYTAVDAFTTQLFADPTKVWTPDELVGFVRGEAPSFAPGKGWEYSNTNYVLLGMVIEKVTGMPMADVFQERLFGPLGMTDTTFPGGSAAIADPHLSGLTAQGQPEGQTIDATGWNPSEAFTAGELISTLDDLKTWADALFTGEGVLTPASQQLRRDSVIYSIPPANSPTSGYGIGIGNKDGWWGHDGQIPGYTTVVVHDYDLDTTIIVVVNSDVPFTDKGPVPAPAVAAGLQKVVTGP